MSGSLTVGEELLMLSYREHTSEQQFRARNLAGSFSVALRATALIELVIAERVSVVTYRRRPSSFPKHFLVGVDTSETGIWAYDKLLAKLSEPRYSKKLLSWWLAWNITEEDVMRGLLGRGVVSEERQVVGPFARNHVVPIDTELDQQLRQRFDDVFLGGGEPNGRDAFMASLLLYGEVWRGFASLNDKDVRGRLQGRDERHAGLPWFDSARFGGQVGAILGALGAAHHSGSGH